MKGLMTDNIDKNLGGCNNEVQFTHHEVLVVEDDPVMQKRIKKYWRCWIIKTSKFAMPAR